MLRDSWCVYRLKEPDEDISSVKQSFEKKFSRKPKYIIVGEGVKTKHGLSTRKTKGKIKLMKMEIALQ